MKRSAWWVIVALAAIGAGLSLYSQNRSTRGAAMPGAVAFRVLLGVSDAEPASWDGSVAVVPGQVRSIQVWRPHDQDLTDGRATWKVRSGLSFTPIGRQAAGQAPPVLENGVLIAATLEDEAGRFDIKTAQGEFSFQAKDVPWGSRKRFLNGRVAVERVPDTVKLTESIEDQDFPAIAASGDEVYGTYVEFVRGDRKEARWGQMGTERPERLDFVARPAGGDQVFLTVYSKSKQAWGAPLAVTAPKQDIMKTAVAVDGKKRVWVFYSANRNGNFDLYAKSWSGGSFSSEVRLTTDPGTDINPVAAADASGRVWVAWQAFRNGNLEVLAAAQTERGFSGEAVVSTSKASDWDPAIAVAPNGEVAIAWDTYDKGDYDVWFRRVRFDNGVRMEAPMAVAASTGFEARASAAYDQHSRLWIAYETSGELWGKDNGPYERTGIPLYRDHNARVKCFAGGKVYEAAAESLEKVLPRGAGPAAGGAGKKGAGKKAAKAAVDAHDTAGPRPGQLAFNSFPRLAVDPAGTVYLAFRSRVQPGRSNAGTVWAENLVYFDGAQWVGPVAVPHADQWIENRPAMAALGAGHLMMLTATDNRNALTLRPEGQRGRQVTAGGLPEVSNADIYAAEMRIARRPESVKLTPVAAEKVAPADAAAGAERQQIEMMRGLQGKIGGEQASVLRGEFHRHTDFSVDGTGDGPLIDAYRYLIDVASMDWGGCCDHDNGTGEYPWWLQQKLTDAYKLGDRYTSMFAYERSVSYPEGHRNAVFGRRGIRPLPRLPKVADDSSGHAPDTQMLYDYLRKYEGVVASHTSGTDMGTDWRDNDPKLEPVVEIYQGCRQNYEMPGAPRSNSEAYSIGGWRPLGFISLALAKGYRLGFQASSDHGSTHLSYCNLWVTKRTREGVMEALRKRRVYGSTDNILAEVRSGSHFMGEEFTTSEPPAISVKLAGTAEFAKVHIVKDGQYVYSVEPKTRSVEFSWKDNAPSKGKTSYYYVRGEQVDGELVWASPMWITYR